MNLPDVAGFASGVPNVPSFASLDPSVVRGLIILGFAFIILIVVGFSRRYLVSSSLQSLWSGVIAGVVIAVALQGAGYWFYKNYIEGEKAASLPENLQIVLQDGRQNVEQVLGVEASAKVPTAQSVVRDYAVLSELDTSLVKSTICKEEQ